MYVCVCVYIHVFRYTVVAEKLNYYRYLSHFRSVHRGQFFTTMKTTAVRKLLPESWGFMCPVHTPDGTPCGLLNHLTASCQVRKKKKKHSSMHVYTANMYLRVYLLIFCSHQRPCHAVPTDPVAAVSCRRAKTVGRAYRPWHGSC